MYWEFFFGSRIPFAVAMFGAWTGLSSITTVSQALTHFNVPDPVWEAVEHQLGQVGEDLRLLAALPPVAITTACGNSVKNNGEALTPVEATMVGLAWRMARRVMANQAGVSEEQFKDVDPWQPQEDSGTSRVNVAHGSGSTTTSNVKEHALKMSALIDQGDDSELTPPTPDQAHQWVQNFVMIMGAMPDETEEPTANQLAALSKRVTKLGAAPYADFAVWLPFERKMAKNHRFRVFTPLGDGSYLQKDIPGPSCFQAWASSWRVFRAACLMLKVASLASLETYYRNVEKLVIQWPSCWGLICAAEDNARADKLEKWRRYLLIEEAQGRQVPRDWNSADPWSCVFVCLAKDEQYWSDKVHIPAAAWTASGGRGAPVVASEVAVTAHFPGKVKDKSDDSQSPSGFRNPAKERRMAKKRRIQADRQELRDLRARQGATIPHAVKEHKGKSKGKGKDQAGNQICFSWASASGTCAEVPPGGECKAQVKRVHKCRICRSPSHQDDQCKKFEMA